MIFLGFFKVFTHPLRPTRCMIHFHWWNPLVPSRCTLGTIAFRPRRPESPRHSSPQKKKLEMASLEPAGVKIFGIHILIPICIYIYTVHIYCIHHILHVNKLPAWVSNGPQLKKMVISEGKSPAKPPGNLHETSISIHILHVNCQHEGVLKFGIRVITIVITHQYTIQSEQKKPLDRSNAPSDLNTYRGHHWHRKLVTWSLTNLLVLTEIFLLTGNHLYFCWKSFEIIYMYHGQHMLWVCMGYDHHWSSVIPSRASLSQVCKSLYYMN